VVRAPWISRAFDMVFLVATVVTAVAVVVGADEGAEAGALTVVLLLTALQWIVLALIWTLLRARRIRRAVRGDRGWSGRLASRRTIRVIIACTACIVLGSGMHIALYTEDSLNAKVVRGVSILMVAIAWVMLHLAYAERYARLELENTGEDHFAFPGAERPSLVEFAYFAFGVGTTFGTTDVDVRSSHARGILIGHGLLSFVYNTAILGMALALLTG
jgi:uncharacterized membrane protein